MFSEMYRVLVKAKGAKVFQGTGQTETGAITIEPNVINQAFYSKEGVENVAEELNKAGFETKIVKGSK